MTEVRINIFDTKGFDHESFDSKHAIQKVTCKTLMDRERLCLKIQGNPEILSIRNSRDMTTVHILTTRNPEATKHIRETIECDEKLNAGCTLETVLSEKVDMRSLIQLMFNSLSGPRFNNEYSNAAGRLFKTVGMIGEKDEPPVEIITLEFSVSDCPDIHEKWHGFMGIGCNVVTFTRTSEKRDMVFKYKPFEQYPQFELTPYGLRHCPFSDKGDTYIIRTRNRKRKKNKNRVDFLNFTTMADMEKTKSDMLNRIINSFNHRFKDILNIELGSVTSVKRAPSGDNPYVDRAKNMLSNTAVHVVNMIEDQSTSDSIVEWLNENDVPHTRTSPGFYEPCIRIIHNEEYYEKHKDVKDPYEVSDRYDICQFVTTESLRKDLKRKMEVILLELAIKMDIENERIRLYDWEKSSYSGGYTFIKRVPGHDKEIIPPLAILKVGKHGEMQFCVLEPMKKFEDWMKHCGSKDMEYAVMSPHGDINVVTNSGLITIPDTKELLIKMKQNKNEKRSENYGMRHEDYREEFLPEVIDYHYIPLSEEHMLYYAGVRGYGMRTKVECAANIRLVHAPGNSKPFLNDLFELMDVTFVRYNRTTISPFPLKYLDEYMKREGLMDEEEDDP